MQPLEKTSHIANIFGAICSFGCFIFAYLMWQQARAQRQPAANPPSPQKGEPLVLSYHPTILIIFAIAVFVLGIVLLVIVIRSERKLRRLRITAQEDKKEKTTEHVLGDPLPSSRPIVVPIRYGKITSGPQIGQVGIVLHNDGEPAYNVAAHSTAISDICTFEMIGTPEQLRKEDSNLSFGCWRNSGHTGTLGSRLYDFMVQHHLDQIAIPVTYRDANFNWYQTDVLLIKDQMARSTGGSESGIRVDWKQKKISMPDNNAEPKPQSHAATVTSGPVPDVALLWELPEEKRSLRMGDPELEKDILIHNRSDRYVYNIQIQPVPLHQELVFGLINEIAPDKQHPTIGRWNGASSVTTKWAHYFCNQNNAEAAFKRGWIHDKVHRRGLSDQFYKIPMAVTYDCDGAQYMAEFDFIYDIGDESCFIKKSARRV